MKVICKISNDHVTKDKSYELKHEYDFSCTHLHVSADNSVDLWTPKRFFYTPQEIRKLKLEKINEL